MPAHAKATRLAELGAGTPAAEAVTGRANVFAMTQAAEDAVLRPEDSGAWPHTLRAALAARIAALNGERDLAAHYAADAGDHAALADPAQDGSEPVMATVLGFMDKIAAVPRDVTAAEVSDLQAAGVDDADIVRLAELNAFLAYQIRVTAGLRLMGSMSA